MIAAVFVGTWTTSQGVAQSVTWVSQFGSAGHDSAWGAAVDGAGNMYVVGSTEGALPGQSSAGDIDGFVRKYDATGAEVWTHQFGTAREDWAWDVAVDGAGGVYVAGYVAGVAPWGGYAGHDALLRKYDAAGNEVWTRLFASVEFGDDEARGVAVDAAGYVYVAGYIGGTLPGQTNAGNGDGFVAKFDLAGNEVWTRQFGTPVVDTPWKIAVDSAGNTFVVGETGIYWVGNTPGDINAFARKFDPSGTELWVREFGTTAGWDRAFGVAADNSGAYVSGYTDGTLPGQISAGSTDAFVRKYDATGNEVWTRQFGTGGPDEAHGVHLSGTGNVYVAGMAYFALPGQTSAGALDAFLRTYDPAGNALCTRQFGTSNSDYAYDVAVDGSGKVYVAGSTYAAFPGQSWAGGFDAFAATIDMETACSCHSELSLSVSVSPNTLWPPDHKMVEVHASVQASDSCGPNPTVTLVSVTSNEPDNGGGDGDTPNDMQIVDPYTFQLRAERSASGTGRVYTATYIATGASGNPSGPVSATVLVPLTMK